MATKFSQVATTPPYPPSFDTLPPPEGGTPKNFSRQNDRKGCSLAYLDGFGHFLFDSGAAGKNSRG